MKEQKSMKARIKFSLKKIVAKFNKIFIAGLLFFIGCSLPEKKSDEVIFLENLMIREGGLFVLMGSKPMVWFSIKESASIPWSKEMQRIWPAWKENVKDRVGPCYAIIEDCVHGNGDSVYFVNIPNTLAILHEHYSHFAKIYNSPFDPLTVVKELQNEGMSLFWKIILQDHYSSGILLGYGSRNAAGFAWTHKNNLTLPPLQTIVFNKGDTACYNLEITAKDLPLPTMTVYGVNDSVIAKYKSERVAIIKKFKGKEFIQVVNEWLKRGAYVDEKWFTEPLKIEWE